MTESAPSTNRWLVLIICCMSLFIVGLDVSGLNVALPSIRSGLDVSESQLQWILDAYTLVLAGLLMFSGSVADRVGRKRLFRIGLTVFGLGSVLCAFAPSGAVLIAARMVQAVGGSMLNPVAMSIITNTFRDPKERAQAIGVWGATVGVSSALGPVVGGLLVQAFDWRAIFWLNVPVVVTALVLSTLFVPESRAEKVRGLDPVGQTLMIVLLGTLVFAIIEGRAHGWTSPLILGLFAASVVAAVVLVVAERRIREPLIDPRFFASVPFSGAVVSAVLAFSAQAGFLFVNTLYLQNDRGMSPVHAGLLMVPSAFCTAALAPLSGRLVGSVGPRVPMLLGGTAIAGSALVLTRLTGGTSVGVLMLAYVLFGCGFGMLNAPITNTAVSGMPRDQAGVAAAVASTSRQVGSALGVALFGTLVFGGSAAQFARASHPAWWLMFGCGAGLAAVALIATTAAAQRSSDRVRQSMAVEA